MRTSRVFFALSLSLVFATPILADNFDDIFSEPAAKPAAAKSRDPVMDAWAKGDYLEAMRICNQEIAERPGKGYSYFQRATTYSLQKQWDKALLDFDKALKLDPQNHDAYANRALLYLEINQPEKALEDCNTGLRITKTNVNLWSNRGETWLKLGNYKSAIADFNISLELVPNLGEAYYYRGLAFEKLHDDKRADSDKAKAKELGYRPGSPAIVDTTKGKGQAAVKKQ